MIKIFVLFFTLALFSGYVSASDNAAYVKEIEAVRAQRVARLTAPDGWLSLVGLHWLKPGPNRIGSAADNDIVLTKAPPYLGVIALNDGKTTITLDPHGTVLIDGKSQPQAELLFDPPTLVSFGTASFFVIKRGDKFGLRVKDSEAESLKNFVGFDYFDIDPSWRIEARWEAFDPPREIEIANVIGLIEKYPTPGVAVFERDGKTYHLTPYIEVPDDPELFIVFADRTSGKETYGAARFLYVDKPKDGKLIIDFNHAYNPPCAFTPYATCPLAPAQNRLDLRVTAGEKKYRGAHD